MHSLLVAGEERHITGNEVFNSKAVNSTEKVMVSDDGGSPVE